MEFWQRLSKNTILYHNSFLSVESHAVELPNGEIIPDWPIIITPDYVDVLAEDTEGKFLIFRQYKYAVGGYSLAPIGGYLEPGEDPLIGAKRELLEETGYISDQWVKLGEFHVDANRGAGIAHLYLARAAQQVQPPAADDLEEQQLLMMDREDLGDAIMSGGFKVLAWCMVVVLGLRYLDQQP